MLIFSLLFLIALAVFAAANLFAAGALSSGIIILITLWLRRKAEFWPMLLSMVLLCGGAGALGGSWGAYLVTSHQTPYWGYAVVAWSGGYILGGIGGVLSGAFGLAMRRRSELPRIENQFKTGFANFKIQLSTLGFRQLVRIGAYSLRLSFSKR